MSRALYWVGIAIAAVIVLWVGEQNPGLAALIAVGCLWWAINDRIDRATQRLIDEIASLRRHP